MALLRGINVGGNNTVPMADLRRVVAGLGHTDVSTYINSGNVLFRATGRDELAIAAGIEDALDAAFGFRPRVLVRTGDDVRAIAAAIPAEWTNGPAMRADVVYLLDGVDPVAAAAQLEPRESIEHVRFGPGAFVWMVGRADATRSRLQRIAGTPLYRQTTIRNVNTARKLADLVGRMG